MQMSYYRIRVLVGSGRLPRSKDVRKLFAMRITDMWPVNSDL